MARLPKWPKKPRSKNPEVIARWVKRTQEVAKRRKELKDAPTKVRKLVDQARNIRIKA